MPQGDFRMHTAMALFELEQALASYVTDVVRDVDSLPRRMRDEIIERAKTRSGEDELDCSTVTGIVRETYIGELIDLAIAASSGRTDNDHLRQLKHLSEHLQLFDIRNAVCHPSRPFPDCYWYRIATIATDPCLVSLNLTRVRKAFDAAVQGNIIPPPDDWLAHHASVIPNNLPKTFDHAITGLIGRDKEVAKFRRYLTSSRFPLIGLIGRGGTGKTALCNQVLSDCCHDPTSLQWCDEVVCVSAKVERLTMSGTAPIDRAIRTIDEMKAEIANILRINTEVMSATDFESVAESLRTRRVLLYLDNLETLLRDTPDQFDDFFSALPAAWRVVVTSRVPVNSATMLALGDLNERGAIQLARDYLERRGGERLSEDVLSKMVAFCDRNPLAIRLVLDSYLAGVEWSESLEQTRSNVLEFSYGALIDAMSRQSIAILECLFGLDEPVDRSRLGYLLDTSLDEIAGGLSQLSRTSLVSRTVEDDTETYSLSSSVRDLLLRFPQDIGVRERVLERLREQRQFRVTLADSNDVERNDACSWNYIAAGTPDHVVECVARAFRSLRSSRSQEERLTMLDALRRTAERDGAFPVVPRAMGFLLLSLHDRYGALAMFRQAAESLVGDPAAALKLAELLRTDKEFQESRRWSGWLLDRGFGDPVKSSLENARKIHKEHWLVATWMNEHEKTRNATSKWREAGDLAGVFGCLFVDSVRRGIERVDDQLKLEAEAYLILSSLDELFAREGYAGVIVHEAFKALDELRRAHRRAGARERLVHAVCDFVNRHLMSMCDAHNERTLGDVQCREMVGVWFEALPGTADSGLRRSFWLEIAGREKDESLSEYGYVTATVYRRPRDGNSFRPYLFARGVDGCEYYVHQNATAISRQDFNGINEGDLISVLPSENGDPGRAWPVRDAVL